MSTSSTAPGDTTSANHHPTPPSSSSSPIKAPYTFIDTIPTLHTLLLDIINAYTKYLSTRTGLHTPFLYIDLEGTDLCRYGSLSLCQLHLPPLQMTYIIDILTLGSEAFTTTLPETLSQQHHHQQQDHHLPLPTPLSIQSLLESPTIIKCFFDVRNDSDALYNLYGISMSNVVDVQILEVATRKGNRRLLNGLKRAIQRDSGLPPDILEAWMEVKMKGKAFFEEPSSLSAEGQGQERLSATTRSSLINTDGGAGAGGGTSKSKLDDKDFAVFDTRPLPRELLEYCINDVIHLPRLWALYDARLDTKWRAKTENEAMWRLQLAKQEVYYGKSGNMALSPF